MVGCVSSAVSLYCHMLGGTTSITRVTYHLHRQSFYMFYTVLHNNNSIVRSKTCRLLITVTNLAVNVGPVLVGVMMEFALGHNN